MQSYQLHINIKNDIEIEVGKRGRFKFCVGKYIYTGSAKKNIDERIKRHQSKSPDKKLHWHIDYLLKDDNVEILAVHKFDKPECILNQEVGGEVIVAGFGSSDCKSGCGSHLKLLKN